ncbi:MAG: hypothetical protein NTV34_11935 [Proteobacteria bacterium]|nr:hypothetical protein [Pseudomonadota bacterium]
MKSQILKKVDHKVDHKVDDNMTPERLRDHWFGGARVPFWNYDPVQLTMGLELEYFIGAVGNQGEAKNYKLATRHQYLEVISYLVEHDGYSDHELHDQPGRVSKDTAHGFIAIKPDFAWHILEIALPPRHTLDELRRLLITTFEEVDRALAKSGLQRLDVSCLPDVPRAMDLVELDRLSGHRPFVGKNKYGDALQVFPALIAATHVHINCSDEYSLKRMPLLYESDRVAQSQYTRAKIFRGQEHPNVRTMFYEEAYGPEYLLRTNPNNIPDSVEAYCDQFNQSAKIFPHDKFFGARDMSYIRPTRHGTFEFRSACSYLDIEKILTIALFRRAQVLGVFSDPEAPDKMGGVG